MREKNRNKKRRIIKVSIAISLIVICFSITYAVVYTTLIGVKKQVITAGTLSLELEEENALTIENAVPMYDEVGMLQDAFVFRLINKTSTDTEYILRLIDITQGQKLDTNLVKYGLTKYGVNKIDYLSNLQSSLLDKGIIKGNEMIEYQLRLWLDSEIEDDNLVSLKKLSYRIDIEANQTNAMMVSTTPFESSRLGDSCETYDDGVDTFLVGQCSKNYVWYSGKLWRVVLRNNTTGEVKLVTDKPMASISYNNNCNTFFENSYADQWLKQEFLPTLHNFENYLVEDSVWDVSRDRNDVLVRPSKETTIHRTVGLLNAYEYYATYSYSNDLATSETGYLKTNGAWFLMTPYSECNMRSVSGKGIIQNFNAMSSNALRPAINFKSSVSFISGTGSIDDPYRLMGDVQQVINGVTQLNTRYSGEYVTFNSELYRIVEVENNLAKIVAVDPPSSLKWKKFHTAEGVTNFGEASIKTDLENYYQKLDSQVKEMIEPNTTWYLGAVVNGENYKTAACNTVDNQISARECEKTTVSTTANIGILRVDELFMSLITRNSLDNYWTLTPNDASNVRILYSGGNIGVVVPTSNFGIRPSMYLKTNVVIANNNTGDGTYEHPYEIQLEQ